MLDKARALGMTELEYKRVTDTLQREPTATELAMISVEWSEHCGYPRSKNLLRLLPKDGHYASIAGADTGGIEVEPNLTVVFKMESHNHPSQVEPRQGAATGIGGIIRDIFTVGARPIANLNSLRFGLLDDPQHGAKARYLFGGVVDGISFYGNCMGIPTVAGEVAFNPSYRGNCLVGAMSVGVVASDAVASSAARGVGNPVMYFGNATGRDGIGGCSILASHEMSDLAARPTVQVGDPFSEKCLLEATIEALRTGAMVSMKDMGAAGLTCTTCEQAADGINQFGEKVGMDINLDLVPLREADMEAFEIMMSESQERMLGVVHLGREQEIIDIFEKWGTNACVVGHVTDDGHITIHRNGEVVAELDALFPAAAFAKAKANLSSVRDAAGKAGGSFGTLGLAITAAFEGVTLANAIETLDRLDDLAEKSGIATEQLSALRFAGETAGTTFEDLAGGLRKLANNMADAAGGGKQSAAAFDAIGVSVKTAEGGLRSSSDVLLEIADRFSRYTDGAGKSALATQIFGKAGETLIPLLNQGSAGIEAQTKLARELGAVYSGELAKGAADFNDNLKRLSLAAEGGKVALLEKLLPGLNQVSNQFIENAKNSNLFLAALQTLKQALEFDLGLDKLGSLQRNAASAGEEVQRVENQLIGLDNTLAREPGNEAAQRRATSLRNKLKDLRTAALAANDAVKEEINLVDPRANAAETQRLLNRSLAGKKAAPIADKTTNKDEGLSQFNVLLDKLKERAAADTLQLSLNRQLTESEKFAVDVESALTGAKSKLSASQKEVVRQRLADVKALDRQLETRALLRAAADADFKAEQESIDLIEQQTEARLQENRGLFDQIAIFGLTSRELDNYRTKQLEVALAVEQGAIATAKAMGAGDGELLALRDKAALLQQQLDLRKQLATKSSEAEDDPLAGAQKAVKDYAENLRKAGADTYTFVTDSLKSLENGLGDALTGKAVDVHALIDQIIAEFIRLKVVKPLLSDIFGTNGTNGSGAGVIGSLLGLFGGFKAAGGSVSAGVPVMTGERGRELFVPRVDGTIVPNSALQSGGESFVFHQTLNVGQGVSRAEVAAALNASNRQLKSEILRSKRRAGAFE